MYLRHTPTSVATTVPRLALGLLLVASGLFLPISGHALESSDGAWISGFARGQFGDRPGSPWLWGGTLQLRYFDLGTGVHDYLGSVALGYAVTPRVNVWLGFARFAMEAGQRRPDENRPWQQIDWRGAAAGGTVTLRARAEQRHVPFGADVRQVLRLYAGFSRPLSGPLLDDWFVNVEPFFDLNHSDWGGGRGLSQHRVFAGVGLRATRRLRLELGAMQQYFHAEQGEDRVNYLAMLNLRWRF